ncbi:MAG: pantoate kinase [Candidatus Thorarchaeota archaeon]|jgi:pantoate kinase
MRERGTRLNALSSQVENMPRSARAFVPGHVTGIFRIHDEHENPLHRGSTGAGFCLDIGTTTSVTLEVNQSREISVKYNDSKIDAPVTVTVIQRLLKGQDADHRVLVKHESSLPIGVGFGASGAGALGTALALSHLLDESIDLESAASHAHYAEVVNHTGLGDVIAQTAGGMEIRVRPGAPGIGEVVNVPFREELCVVLAGAPGLETKRVLTDENHRNNIIRVADDIMNELTKNPTFDHFVSCSKEFARETNLMTHRVGTALDELESAGFSNSSMVMLGDSVFCICDNGLTQHAVNILTEHWDKAQILVTSVSAQGGRLV